MAAELEKLGRMTQALGMKLKELGDPGADVVIETGKLARRQAGAMGQGNLIRPIIDDPAFILSQQAILMGGRTVLRESSTSRELSLLTTRRLLRHSRFQIDGVALRRLRIERNMPQTQMAEQSGYSQPSISDLETGRHSMLPMEDIQSLASALGVAPEAIIRAPAGVEQKLEG